MAENYFNNDTNKDTIKDEYCALTERKRLTSKPSATLSLKLLSTLNLPHQSLFLFIPQEISQPSRLDYSTHHLHHLNSRFTIKYTSLYFLVKQYFVFFLLKYLT